MNVTIVGTGQVGRALGRALGRSGHAVTYGVRHAEPARPDAKAVAEAIRDADATILAVPFGALAEVIAAAGSLAGKILCDATNPLAMVEGELALAMGHSTSGAEQLAALAPGARVFKAFNQTGFENMADAGAYVRKPVMFVAGDDLAGKRIVLSLVADAGFDAVDAGGLRQARLLEPLAMLWIELARKGGRGADFAFTLQQKGAVR